MRQSFAFLCIVSLLLIAPVTVADMVILKNGDRITGKVVRMSSESLIVRTPYAGEITIERTAVDAFTTDKPVRLYFRDLEPKTAIVQRDDSGTQVIVDPDTESRTPFDLQSLADINPPKHVSGEGYTWSGNVNFGFQNERGNTDKEEYHVDAEIGVRGKGVRYRLNGEYERELTNSRTTKNQWELIGSYNRDLRNKWYLFTNLFSEGDSKKDLELRATGSVGPGYRFFDSDDLNLSVEAGPGYTVERWDGGEQGDDEYVTARWGIEYDQYVYRRFAQLFHKQNGVWNLETTDDYVINARTGVHFDLTKHIRSTVSFDYEYDNAAPKDRDKTDTKVLATVGYKW